MPDSKMQPAICDYEGSTYRTDFWEGQGRAYEDRVERAVLRRLLPPRGERLLEVGAGFGRLTDEYRAYRQVVLLDYSLSHLQDACARLGTSERYVYVAANAYQLPFQPGVFDAVTVIRVLHHMADAPAFLRQMRRALVPGGSFVLEFANKRNLKAMLRHTLKRQRWSPYRHEPVEFVRLNFDFHPAYIRREVCAAGFEAGQFVPVSFFRVGVLKRVVPPGLLARCDAVLQRSGALYTPSVFSKHIAVGDTLDHLACESIFACPECGGELIEADGALVCRAENLRWAVREGIYDFREPAAS